MLWVPSSTVIFNAPTYDHWRWDPEHLPKRRRQSYTPCKNPKPENQYSLHGESLKSKLGEINSRPTVFMPWKKPQHPKSRRVDGRQSRSMAVRIRTPDLPSQEATHYTNSFSKFNQVRPARRAHKVQDTAHARNKCQLSKIWTRGTSNVENAHVTWTHPEVRHIWSTSQDTLAYGNSQPTALSHDWEQHRVVTVRSVWGCSNQLTLYWGHSGRNPELCPETRVINHTKERWRQAKMELRRNTLRTALFYMGAKTWSLTMTEKHRRR